jgi:hypothetical protein
MVSPCREPAALTKRLGRMGQIGKLSVSSLGGSLACASPAAACTLCHSVQATSIRARLFGPDLLWTLSAVMLPLALLLCILALVLREPPAEVGGT